MPRLTAAQALVRLLAIEQVPFAFGIVGGKLAPLMHALSQQQAVRFVGVRHEASAPMMAAAVHAGSGRMAVAVGDMGPGVPYDRQERVMPVPFRHAEHSH